MYTTLEVVEFYSPKLDEEPALVEHAIHQNIWLLQNYTRLGILARPASLIDVRYPVDRTP